jgi:hypothetical protein
VRKEHLGGDFDFGCDKAANSEPSDFLSHTSIALIVEFIVTDDDRSIYPLGHYFHIASYSTTSTVFTAPVVVVVGRRL